MPVVELPSDPQNKELEEYVSSYFQAAGYFVERNIIDRDIGEVLELDGIVTDYESTVPELRLIEVKSGKWGFNEIFKVSGWLNYLNLPRAIFITNSCKEQPKQQFYAEKADGILVDLVCIPDLETTSLQLADHLKGTSTETIDVSCWRFSYWIERVLVKRLTHSKKTAKDRRRYGVLADYYHQLNSGIFFEENLLNRVRALYRTFEHFGRISARCANEIVGGKFDQEVRRLPPKLFRDTYYQPTFNDIQISTYVEHRARLSILKNAVDIILVKRANASGNSRNRYRSFLGQEARSTSSLPYSFRHAMDELEGHEWLHLYPRFWQWFLFCFGGFILEDVSDQEYGLLSSKTGIPKNQIDQAISAYDLLFPNSGGWLTHIANGHIRVIKMHSVPFMGLGANYRRWAYTDTERFEDMPIDRWLLDEYLRRWNQLLLEVLA